MTKSYGAETRIVELKQALKIVASWRVTGQKVVFTNGCFDVFHKGHAVYLAKASALGSRLIVGLNTDDSVRRLKGENRPINDEEARAYVLAANRSVDLVVPFSEDTPYELIKTLLPDILVKGSDYSVENIVGSDIVIAAGGEVKTIDFVTGFSSTNIIQKSTIR